jgi:hypothetical protein
MGLSNSCMTKKSQLKKKGWSEEEIWKYLSTHGYIGEKAKTETPVEKTDVKLNAVKVVNTVDEDAYVRYLLKCINGEGDIRVCTEIRNYLDKKKAIAKQQPKEIDADFTAANDAIAAD